MVSGNTYEDGQLAAESLFRLFDDIGVRLRPNSAPPIDKTKRVLGELWARSSRYDPPPALLGFLSAIMYDDGYDGSILRVWGLDTLMHDQRDIAPICEIPPDSGLIAFADWTGEGDGDTWCYDGKFNRIRCLPVGCGCKDADQLRLHSYGVSRSFHQLVAYLRCDAEPREWIPKH